MISLKPKNQQEIDLEISKHGISDDNFTIMPKQYIPNVSKAPRSSGSGKKFIVLGFGIFSFMVLFAAIFYFFIFYGNEPEKQIVLQDQTENYEEKQESLEEISEIKQEENIYVQSFDEESSSLLGSINLSVPLSLLEKYKEGIGSVSVKKSEIYVPKNIKIVGGAFSLYPSGILFDDPVLTEITTNDIPLGIEKEDLYPVYFTGSSLENIKEYETLDLGFSFVMEKFPLGPVAIVYEEKEETASTTLEYTKPSKSEDSDVDGLTDMEENLMGMDFASTDSDSDGYGDLEEIKNGYSPIGKDGARLSDSGIFLSYKNPDFGYSVEYPKDWLADSIDKTNKQVLFVSETEEFFEILIEENPSDTPIVDWYRSQSPSLSSAQIDITVINSRPAVWSPDGLTLYTSKDGLIYILTYNKGTREDINWPNIFEHFIKTFVFGDITEPSQDQSQSQEQP